MSPAKPTRKLRGGDHHHQTLLLPPDPASDTPLPPLSTCHLDPTNPYFSNPYMDCAHSSVALSEANSLSWDYGEVCTVPRRGMAPGMHPHHRVGYERTLRTQSYPPPGTSPVDRRPQTLDVRRDDWLGLAPLASPETLSETSSMDSLGSKRFSNGYQKLTSSAPKMAPIKQSPLRQTRSDGYRCFMEPPSPVGRSNDSRERDLTGLSLESSVAARSCSSPMLYRSPESPERVDISPGQPMAHSTPGNPLSEDPLTFHAANHAAALPPIAQSTPLKPPTDQAPPSPETCSVDMSDVETEGVFNSTQDSCSLDLGCQPLDSSCPHDVTNLTAVGARIQHKVDNIQSQDPYKLTYASETLTSEDYVSHSPDSLTEPPGRPVLYDSVVGHYSPAGRGYPHGAYMAQYTDTTSTDRDCQSLIEQESEEEGRERVSEGYYNGLAVQDKEPLQDSCSSPPREADHQTTDNSDAVTAESALNNYAGHKIIWPQKDCSSPTRNGSAVSVCEKLALGVTPNGQHTPQEEDGEDEEEEDVDYEMMSDTPIQIMTNEAYL